MDWCALGTRRAKTLTDEEFGAICEDAYRAALHRYDASTDSATMASLSGRSAPTVRRPDRRDMLADMDAQVLALLEKHKDFGVRTTDFYKLLGTGTCAPYLHTCLNEGVQDGWIAASPARADNKGTLYRLTADYRRRYDERRLPEVRPLLPRKPAQSKAAIAKLIAESHTEDIAGSIIVMQRRQQGKRKHGLFYRCRLVGAHDTSDSCVPHWRIPYAINTTLRRLLIPPPTEIGGQSGIAWLDGKKAGDSAAALESAANACAAGNARDMLQFMAAAARTMPDRRWSVD